MNLVACSNVLQTPQREGIRLKKLNVAKSGKLPSLSAVLGVCWTGGGGSTLLLMRSADVGRRLSEAQLL